MNSKGEEKIFVSISSYLDIDVKNTIIDCIQKSKNPSRLTFGICWQYDENHGIQADFLDDLKDEFGVQIIKFNFLSSEGPSWAKEKAKQLYNNEEFCLLVDAHMRFAKDWDEVLMSNFYELKEKTNNPIISFLPPAFDKNNFEHLDQPDLLNHPKIISVTPDNIFEYEENNLQHTQFKSIPSPIIEPCFIFAEGKWLESTTFDKHIYYIGEEVYHSVNSYTLGYDFFLPKQIVAWHRAYYPARIKHYTTHPASNPKEKLSHSLKCLNDLLLEKEVVPPNSGFRNLSDYEAYAGIKFNLSS